MIDLTTSTLDQLQAEFVRLAAIVADASDQRTQILKTIEARKAAVKAKFAIDQASELERDVLRAVLEVETTPATAGATAAAQSVSTV